jgi:hypothetical protein
MPVSRDPRLPLPHILFVYVSTRVNEIKKVVDLCVFIGAFAKTEGVNGIEQMRQAESMKYEAYG